MAWRLLFFALDLWNSLLHQKLRFTSLLEGWPHRSMTEWKLCRIVNISTPRWQCDPWPCQQCRRPLIVKASHKSLPHHARDFWDSSGILLGFLSETRSSVIHCKHSQIKWSPTKWEQLSRQPTQNCRSRLAFPHSSNSFPASCKPARSIRACWRVIPYQLPKDGKLEKKLPNESLKSGFLSPWHLSFFPLTSRRLGKGLTNEETQTLAVRMPAGCSKP